jgi:hypothetical protein
VASLSAIYLSLDLSLSRGAADELAQHLLQVTQIYSSTIYRQSVRVEIEHHAGSWKAVVTVLGSICLVFNQYGQLRSNVDWLIKDASSLKEYLHETIIKEGLDEKRILEIKRRECTPDRIRRIFRRIEKYQSKSLDAESQASLEREKELICNMIARVVNEELSHEQDQIMFIQALDEGFMSGLEDRLQLSPRSIDAPRKGYYDALSEPSAGNELALKQSSRFAILEPREDFVFPTPPTISKEYQ